MTEQSVISTVIEVLKECQDAFGHDDGASITPNTVPHGGLKGFQSDVTPTVVRRVAKRIGSPLADEVDPVNIFASEDKRKKLSIKEAAKRFLEMYDPKGGKK